MSSILKVDTIQTAAGGTPTAASLGLNVSGSVLQVVSAYQGSGVVTFTAGATLLTANITPTSANSKILIIASGSSERYTSTNTDHYFGNVNRSIGGGADAFLGRWADAAHYISSTSEREHASITILDTPNTTSQITYKMTTDVYGGGYYAKQCSITLIEIAG